MTVVTRNMIWELLNFEVYNKQCRNQTDVTLNVMAIFARRNWGEQFEAWEAQKAKPQTRNMKFVSMMKKEKKLEAFSAVYLTERSHSIKKTFR